MSRRGLVKVVSVLLVVPLVAVFLLPGCSRSWPNQNPVGSPFPAVLGRSLEKEDVRLPEAYAGEPVVLLVGYRQRTQFDLDRWILGLLQAEVEARIVEVPTLPGLATSLSSRWIDDGMRSGIPKEDWGSVVTVYGDQATPIASFTGNERGHLGRVLLLDRSGEVIWFDDEGYSARKVLEIASLVSSMREEPPGTP